MNLAITGLGMISAIGRDVRTACAALRCGITRSRELHGYAVQCEGEFEMQPIIGYPISGVTDGYEGMALQALLAVYALNDLISYSSLDKTDSHFWQRTGIIICTSKTRDENVDYMDDVILESLAKLVQQKTGLPFLLENCRVFLEGHSSTLKAIPEAVQAFKSNLVDRAIILGVDSLTNNDAVDEYGSSGRLKSGANPVGFIPGEAGAAFLIEPYENAQQRNTSILAGISLPVLGREENHRLQDNPSDGRALADVIIKAVKSSNKTVDTFYADLNGETKRAAEWGNAFPKLKKHLGLEKLDLQVPAESLGDTGVASAAVAICAAVRSFLRGYSRSENVLICSFSDDGDLAAVTVSKCAA